MNRWNIPKWLEEEVRERDKKCVYCGVLFGSIPGVGSKASWEHIINDAKIITRENITLCCRSCNSSKGARILSDWLLSPYCQKRGISHLSVADVVRKAIE